MLTYRIERVKQFIWLAATLLMVPLIGAASAPVRGEEGVVRLGPRLLQANLQPGEGGKGCARDLLLQRLAKAVIADQRTHFVILPENTTAISMTIRLIDITEALSTEALDASLLLIDKMDCLD